MEKQSNAYTSLGVFPSELITFYDNGNLNRIFPLNGQINGYLSEEDEGKLAESYHFDLSVGSFSAKIIALRFFKSGRLRGLTLWPGETIEIKTPIGVMEVKTGFTLYEDGQLETLEPAKPEIIHTELGSFLSFDADALGIHGDDNSLAFTLDGALRRLKTTTHGIAIRDQDGNMTHVGPKEVPSYVDISESVIMPMTVTMEETTVTIYNGDFYSFDRSENEFTTYESNLIVLAGCTNCSSCNAC